MFKYENRNPIPWMRLVLGLGLWLAFLQPSLLAQARLVATAATVLEAAENDRTARAGDILLFATDGTTSPEGILLVDFGLPIAVEGRVSGLAGVSIDEVDADTGVVSVLIPAGMTSGDSFRVEGFRFDMTATDATSVVAELSVESGAGFFFLPQNPSVRVISDVRPALQVDTESHVVISIARNSVTTAPEELNLVVKESFRSAFSGDTDYFNQNAATRLRIQVEGLPAGASLTFPEEVDSRTTSATLEVLSGSETTLPTKQGGLSITYEFSPADRSDRRTETFRFNYTLEVEERLDRDRLVFLQVTLAPGEDELCSGVPCVPRYREQLLPLYEDLPLPEFESYFPGSVSLGQLTRLQFTNAEDFELGVQLEALSPDGEPVSGPDIVNPATVTIEGEGHVSALLENIFGTGITEVETGTIVARSRRGESGQFFLFGDDSSVALDGGAAVREARTGFLLPNLAREGRQPFTRLHLFNPSPATASEVTLALHDSAGAQVASVERSLGPRETISGDAATLFDVDPLNFQGGYIRGAATEGVAASQTFGNEMAVNHLPAQSLAVQQQSYGVAHVAVGAGLETELNLINSDDSKQAQFRITVVDDAGQTVAGPAEIDLEPQQQRVVDLSTLFELPSTSVLVGSLEIELANAFIGPFLSVAEVNGSVRLKRVDGRLSTALPLYRVQAREVLYVHLVQAQEFFTGVAFKNRTTAAREVTVEAYDAPGNLVGEAEFELAAGARTSKLLFELIPATAGQSGGSFRVSSPEGAVESFALFGDFAGNVIATVPRN